MSLNKIIKNLFLGLIHISTLKKRSNVSFVLLLKMKLFKFIE